MRTIGAVCTIFGISAALVLAAAWPAIATTQQQPQIDPNASYPCCNPQTGEIVGEMTIMACAQRPGHVPKIPGTPGSENLCAAPQGGGGGPAGDPGDNMLAPTEIRAFEDEPVWDEYEDNIPNGSFERWRGKHPIGFGSYRRHESVREFPPELRDFETVFRSGEAFEGGTAIELKNFYLDIRNRLQGAAQIPPQVRRILENLALPGGTLTCKDNCPLGATRGGSARELRIPVEAGGNAICGAYRDELKGTDVLFASVSLYAGGDMPVAGATAMDIRSVYRSRDRDGWIKFRLPIDRNPMGGSGDPSEATIQFQIMSSINPAAATFGGLNGPMLNKDSRVLIDAVHFCKVIDLQVTDSESTGGAEVPESEDELGGMTWVNWDNDDADGIFDHEDTEVGEAEDDLAKLVMTLPQNARGEAILKTVSGGGKFKLWESETKAPGTLWSKSDQPLEIEEEFELRDGEYVKELWVEGLEVSEETGEIEWEFEYRPESGAPAETDTVAFTVLGVDELSWKGIENSRNDDENLDPDPNHPIVEARAGGPVADPDKDAPVRVFPGKRFVGASPTENRRDEVELVIRMAAPPPRATLLYLRSFDIDDPSANDDEVDDETSRGDNRQDFGGGNGDFTLNDRSRLEYQVNREEHRTGFRVTMQPGDNFRVVAFGDEDFIGRIENDDTKLGKKWEDGARIVDPAVLDSGKTPEDAEVREADHFVSDTLTVWRFLHVELDSMSAVEKQQVSGTIYRIQPAGTISGLPAQTLFTNADIVDQRPPSADGPRGQVDSFRGGRLSVAGYSFAVAGNTANGSTDDRITIAGSNLNDPAVLNAIIRQTFTMVDDDIAPIALAGSPGTTGPWNDGAAIPLPPDDRLRDTSDNAYFPAYVYPRLDTLRHSAGSFPFVGNLKTDRDITYIRSFFSQYSALDYHDDPDIWTAYLLGAFQGVHWEDADGAGVGGVAGEADGTKGTGALIYWASGGELEATNNSGPGWRLIDAVVHEIGHLFGGDHDQEGLMSDGVDGHPPPTGDFSPKTLDKIRSAQNP